MTRTEGFLPKVPQIYRGIEVCDHVANRWLSYEGTMWRMGIDQALDAVTETVVAERRAVDDAGSYFYSEWEEGLQTGKERAAENIEDAVLDKYKKENS
jgi:hypothetical protein